MNKLLNLAGLLAPVAVLAAAFALPPPPPKAPPKAPAGPVRVAVRLAHGRYQFVRGGRPYFVRGAGGQRYPERVAAAGGNSLRTWDTRDAAQVLRAASAHGLTVLLGLDVARERHGFDYHDPATVARQRETLRAEVVKYRNHPAVLAWAIGNELNLGATDPAVWTAVNELARLIHALDPNHPVTTVLAGVGPAEVALLKTHCPDLDFLSINTYAGLATMPRDVAASGWTGPYLVGEWGPTGHWECPQTPWKAPVEETSAQKAAVYRARYEASVPQDSAHCLGSYVFYWGQKQERTPTWYGLFTADGQESEVLDVMQYLWTGRWPRNRAPHLSALLLAGKPATDSVRLRPNAAYPILARVTDPDRDPLTYRWELLPESTAQSVGGDREAAIEPLVGQVAAGKAGAATLQAPGKPGAYRLFLYASDGHNNVATANVPFLVGE